MILILLVLTMISPIFFVIGIMNLIDRIRYGKNHNEGSLASDVFYTYLMITFALGVLLIL